MAATRDITESLNKGKAHRRNAYPLDRIGCVYVSTIAGEQALCEEYFTWKGIPADVHYFPVTATEILIENLLDTLQRWTEFVRLHSIVMVAVGPNSPSSISNGNPSSIEGDSALSGWLVGAFNLVEYARRNSLTTLEYSGFTYDSNANSWLGREGWETWNNFEGLAATNTGELGAKKWEGLDEDGEITFFGQTIDSINDRNDFSSNYVSYSITPEEPIDSDDFAKLGAFRIGWPGANASQIAIMAAAGNKKRSIAELKNANIVIASGDPANDIGYRQSIPVAKALQDSGFNIKWGYHTNYGAEFDGVGSSTSDFITATGWTDFTADVTNTNVSFTHTNAGTDSATSTTHRDISADYNAARGERYFDAYNGQTFPIQNTVVLWDQAMRNANSGTAAGLPWDTGSGEQVFDMDLASVMFLDTSSGHRNAQFALESNKCTAVVGSLLEPHSLGLRGSGSAIMHMTNGYCVAMAVALTNRQVLNETEIWGDGLTRLTSTQDVAQQDRPMKYHTAGYPQVNTDDASNSHTLGVFYGNLEGADQSTSAGVQGIIAYGGADSPNVGLQSTVGATAWLLDDEYTNAFEHTPMLFVNCLNTTSLYADGDIGSPFQAGEKGFVVVLSGAELNGEAWPFGNVILKKGNSSQEDILTPEDFTVGMGSASYFGTGIPATAFGVLDTNEAIDHFNVLDQSGGNLTNIIIEDFGVRGFGGAGVSGIISNKIITR